MTDGVRASRNIRREEGRLIHESLSSRLDGGGTVQFVAINGFCEDTESPWKDDSGFWLDQWLLRDFPLATLTVLNLQLRELTNWRALLDCGERLLSELKGLAYLPGTCQIFLCHGLGGLIFQKALQLAHTANDDRHDWLRPCLSIFFGTPAGLDCKPELIKKIVKDCATVESAGKEKLIDDLTDAQAHEILDVAQAFAKTLTVPSVVFSERAETPIKKATIGWKRRLLVSESIANLKGNAIFPLQRDHAHIACPDKGAYSHLKPKLEEVVKAHTVNNTARIEPPASSSINGSERGSLVIINKSHLRNTTPSLFKHDDTTSGSMSTQSAEVDEMLRFPSSGRYQVVKLPCRTMWHHQRNPHFVGRGKVLAQLRTALLPEKTNPRTSQRAFALWGVGGAGKTQVAIKFALDSVSYFPSILWARADSEEKLLQSFSEHAKDLGLVTEQSKDPTVARDALLRWYAKTDTHWLLVFDNADNLKILKDFWPTGAAGSVLVTSRDHTSATSTLAGAGEELMGLDALEAIDLMRKLLGRTDITESEQNDLASIVETVRYLPLALQSMAGTMLETRCSVHEFATQCIELPDIIEGSDLENIDRPTARYEYSLQTVWKSSLDTLDKDHSVARRFLEALSFLDPDGIQDALMAACVGKRVDGERPPLFSKKPALLRTRGILLKLSLVGASGEGETSHYYIHRLIRAYVQSQLTDEAHVEALETALDMITQVWPVPLQHDRTQGTYWIAQEKYMPHVRSLREAYEHYSDESGDIQSVAFQASYARLMNGAAWYCYTRGLYADAWPLLEAARRSASIAATTNSSHNSILLDTFQTSGAVATESGEFERALPAFQRAQKTIYALFDSGDLTRPDTREAQIAGGLGNCYNGLGRNDEAEEKFLESLRLWTAPTLPVYGIMLGVARHHNGKLGEAENTIRDIIEVRRQRFGPEDAVDYRTGLAYYYLGNIKLDQKLYQEAFHFHCVALRLYKETQGYQHLRVGLTCHKLGLECMEMGQHVDSIKLFQQAIEVFETGLAKHSSQREVARSKYLLSQAFRSIGDEDSLRRADELEQEADNIRKNILGANYFPPNGAKSYNDFVSAWSR